MQIATYQRDFHGLGKKFTQKYKNNCDFKGCLQNVQ